MKLHIASDLHLGHTIHEPFRDVGDILILAGDIIDDQNEESYSKLKCVVTNYVSKDKPVIMICGNHELYGHQKGVHHAIEYMRQQCKDLRITFLHNEKAIFGDIVFVGTTLWTDFKLYGDQGKAMRVIQRRLSDYVCIRIKEKDSFRILKPIDTLKLHNESVDALKRLSNNDTRAIVVITHHAPHSMSVHDTFIGDIINPGFVSHLPELIKSVNPTRL